MTICQELVGWTWACPSTSLLVFLCFGFFYGGCFKRLFFSSFFFSSLFSCISSLQIFPSPSSSFLGLFLFQVRSSLIFSSFFFNVLMVEFFEVRNFCPSISFFFARLRAFLEDSSGHRPQVGLFVSRDSPSMPVLTAYTIFCVKL